MNLVTGLYLANDLLRAECRFYITSRMRGNKTFRSSGGGFYILDGAGDSVQSFIISHLRQITLNIYLLEL